MVVSDLGLTAVSGDDGVHAIVQSLATAAPARGRRSEARRAQQRGAGDEDDRRRRPRRFRSGPVARQGRLRAGAARRDARGGDYGFLSLTQSAFDLTDRGVAGARRRRALDAFLYTERGVYRSGETVFVTALLRDAKGGRHDRPAADAGRQAAGRRRIPARDDRGPRCRRACLRPAAAARRGARASGRSSPMPIRRRERSARSSSCSRTTFPSGSILRFIRRSDIRRAGRTDRNLARRALPLWRARRPGSTSPARSASRRSTGADFPAIPAMSRGLADDEFTPVQEQFSDKVADRCQWPRRPVCRAAGRRRDPPARGETDRRRRRAGRPHGRAHRHAADARQRRDDRRQEGLRRLHQRRRRRHFRGDRGCRRTARASLARACSGRSIGSTNDYQWFNSEGRWSFEPVKSSKRVATGSLDIAADGSAKISAPVSWGAHRLEVKTARRRADQLRLRCRLVGQRRAPTRRTMSS